MNVSVDEHIRQWCVAFSQNPIQNYLSSFFVNKESYNFLTRNKIRSYAIDESDTSISEEALLASQLHSEAVDIFKFLDVHDLNCVVLKGFGLSGNLYGDMLLRESGDLDILVETGSLQPLHRWLIERGYKQRISVLGAHAEMEAQPEAPIWKPNGRLLSEYIKMSTYLIKIEVHILPACLDKQPEMLEVPFQLLASRRREHGIDIPEFNIGFIFFCLDKRKDFIAARSFCLRDILDLARGFVISDLHDGSLSLLAACSALNLREQVSEMARVVLRVLPELTNHLHRWKSDADDDRFGWIQWEMFVDPATDGVYGLIALTPALRLHLSNSKESIDLGPAASASVTIIGGDICITLSLRQDLSRMARSLEITVQFARASVLAHQFFNVVLRDGSLAGVQQGVTARNILFQIDANDLQIIIPVDDDSWRGANGVAMFDVNVYRGSQPVDQSGHSSRILLAGALNIFIDRETRAAAV